MRAAALFRDQVRDLEAKHMGEPLGGYFELVRSCGSACFMSATASIEALINELFISPEVGLRSRIADFEQDYWGRKGIESLSPLTKYQRALRLLGLPEMDEQTKPFLEADALIGLRNALVHYKPTWDPARPRKVDLVTALRGLYTTSPFVDPGSDFITMQSMSADSCRWAVSSACAFIREFQQRSGLDKHKLERICALEA
jgi:hypothetical protein